jgi:hypothetical protein
MVEEPEVVLTELGINTDKDEIKKNMTKITENVESFRFISLSLHQLCIYDNLFIKPIPQENRKSIKQRRK